MTKEYEIILYYNYVDIQDPDGIMKWQQHLTKSLGLKGRVIIASEGINGTLEGDSDAIDMYIKSMHNHPVFESIKFKRSAGTGNAFPRLSVRVRPQIVSSQIDDPELGPHRRYTGKYITADQLHLLLHPKADEQKKEFYIIDMRNDYEFAVGHFEGSILPNGLRNFRDLPKALKSILHLKDKMVITVCTGGVRCESASGYLIKHGFSNVYQLQDGIVTYMEKYPNEDFLGKLYVFDGRMLMGFNTDSPDHVIVGKCRFCKADCENLINHKENGERKHEIVCQNCIAIRNIILD